MPPAEPHAPRTSTHEVQAPGRPVQLKPMQQAVLSAPQLAEAWPQVQVPFEQLPKQQSPLVLHAWPS